jgi:hypothetical protein
MLEIYFNIKNTKFSEDCIVVGDFNVIRNSAEKRGGNFGRDPFREKMEELIEDWDMLDISPQRGKFTWTNMRAKPRAYCCMFGSIHCS